MKEALLRVKEYGRKIGNVVLWGLAILFALIGSILIIDKTWAGILLILSAFSLVPILRKRIPIKVWQQIIACLVLFVATVIFLPKTVSAPSGTGLQSSVVPASPSTSSNPGFIVKFYTGEYAGAISENKPDGMGMLTYSNLGTYKGLFQGGKRNGTGTFSWKNGDVYSGQWKDDKINGSGTITFSKDSKLTAAFNNNAIISGDYVWADNNGTYTMHVENSTSKPVYTLEASYSNKVSYKGAFSNGSLNGQGTMSYPNLGTYAGEFENGKKNGAGEFIWSDGDKFSGIWVNDQMDGNGLYTFANGSTLSGPFKSNVPQGILTYTYQGKAYKTVWSSGKCTSITKA